MSFVLGGITLPSPVSFKRVVVEKQSYNETLTGIGKRDIMNRKDQYVLEFVDLTQAEVDSILSEYNLMAVRNFTVSETNLSIGPTSVHIMITDREYVKGPDFRERLTLVLTEVS